MFARMMLAALVCIFAVSPVLAEEEAKSKEEAPAIQPVDKPGSLKPGKALMNEGKWAEAAAYFEGIGVQEYANGLAKREPWRLNNWARCLVALEKYDEAVTVAQRGLDIAGTNSALWNNKGSAQSRAGKHDEAMETFKKGIEVLEAADKDASRLKSNLQFLEDARAGLIDEEGNRIEKKEEAEEKEAEEKEDGKE